MNEGHTDYEMPVPRPEAAVDPAAHASEPAGWLWLYYLHFRPRIFFPHFAVDASPALTAFCAWLLGISAIIDEIAARADVGTGTTSATGGWFNQWGVYWAVVLVVGTLGGLAYFAIGGWWYRTRLRWSGQPEPDAALARRVYLYASMVAILLPLLQSVVDSLTYASPAEAVDVSFTPGRVGLSALLCLWSVWVSYSGAMTVFSLRRGRAMLWLLILPGGLYTLLFGFAALGLVAMTHFGPADVDNPQLHDSPSMTFQYPGNWDLATDRYDYDPDGDLRVESSVGVSVHVRRYQSGADAEADVRTTLLTYRATTGPFTETGRLDSWGRYEGCGCTAHATVEGEPIELVVFVHDTPAGDRLRIVELVSTFDPEWVLPGIEQIRSTSNSAPFVASASGCV